MRSSSGTGGGESRSGARRGQTLPLTGRRPFAVNNTPPPCRPPSPSRLPQIQRRHREERMLGNREVLDYLLSIGVERIQCLMVYGKAAEALLLKYGPEEAREEPRGGLPVAPPAHTPGPPSAAAVAFGSAGKQSWFAGWVPDATLFASLFLRPAPPSSQDLTLEDVQASVVFLKEMGLTETQLPKARTDATGASSAKTSDS